MSSVRCPECGCGTLELVETTTCRTKLTCVGMTVSAGEKPTLADYEVATSIHCPDCGISFPSLAAVHDTLSRESPRP